ncbi:MAG: TIGR01459 family HAD-type hydrolase [Hyphomicrobiaceae bacterium]|nr:TIGR01459 family HAD-type hydrolase [Hyphomicrobiaceae bacterium]
MNDRSPPPILERAGPLLEAYDVLFCDVWGVIHDGHEALPGASDALQRFRARGGTVILVSNAPVPKHRVAAMLDERALSRRAWDDIVASGDLALAHIGDTGYRAFYGIGPQERDAALFSALPGPLVELAAADAIVCTGLDDDINETAESYRPVLERALERRLPFVCANPDLVVDVGGRLYLCAGAIADLYEHMGGPVYWAGKPFPPAYGTAHARAEAIRGGAVHPSLILAIGDAVRTDLKAAEAFGIDALFIAGGIHREDVVRDGVVCPVLLAELLSPDVPGATAAMAKLGW